MIGVDACGQRSQNDGARLGFTSDNTPLSTPSGGVDRASGNVESGVVQLIAEPASVQSIAHGQVPADVMRYVQAATAENTRRAYRGDVADFIAFGGCIPSTPEQLAAYMTSRAALHAPATIMRRVIGIGRAHSLQGYADPSKTDLVRTVARGLRRTHGRPQRQAAPFLREELVRAVSIAHGMRGLRDRALLLLGFAAALRRSELVGLDVEHLERAREGVVVHLVRSKTDQEGHGRRIAVPYGRTQACPVTAIDAWLGAAAIERGPVFRSLDKAGAVGAARLSAQSVSLIVKHRANAMGLDPAAFSAHSLRAGLVTSAAQAGVTVSKIQAQTGHRSLAVLARYVRDAKIFENNAAGLLL